MSDFLNAREIAAIVKDSHLENFPSSVSNILKIAKVEMWHSRKRQGRGGGMEYAVSSLPQPVQQAILQKQTAELLSQAR
ncbi:DNA-binding protein, partial [Kingella oralis]|uniref:DNA-binding protein n=1 Tax=Kingella oralis TaxID=505 RepID=UPI0034E3F0F3